MSATISRRQILSRSRDAGLDALQKFAPYEDYEEMWFTHEHLFKDHIAEVLRKWEQIDDEIWAKMIFMNRNRRIAKAYIRVPAVIVNGGDDGFDGYRVGLNGLEDPFRDAHTDKLMQYIDECRIGIDDSGNIILKRYSNKSGVYVKSYPLDFNESCIGTSVIKSGGAIELDKPYVIFDMAKFERAMAREMKSAYPDRRRLEQQCIVVVAFVRNHSTSILDLPIYVMLINIVALDLLKSKLNPVIYQSISDHRMVTDATFQRSNANGGGGGGGGGNRAHGTILNPINGTITTAAAAANGTKRVTGRSEHRNRHTRVPEFVSIFKHNNNNHQTNGINQRHHYRSSCDSSPHSGVSEEEDDDDDNNVVAEFDNEEDELNRVEDDEEIYGRLVGNNRSGGHRNRERDRDHRERRCDDRTIRNSRNRRLNGGMMSDDYISDYEYRRFNGGNGGTVAVNGSTLPPPPPPPSSSPPPPPLPPLGRLSSPSRHQSSTRHSHRPPTMCSIRSNKKSSNGSGSGGSSGNDSEPPPKLPPRDKKKLSKQIDTIKRSRNMDAIRATILNGNGGSGDSNRSGGGNNSQYEAIEIPSPDYHLHDDDNDQGVDLRNGGSDDDDDAENVINGDGGGFVGDHRNSQRNKSFDPRRKSWSPLKSGNGGGGGGGGNGYRSSSRDRGKENDHYNHNNHHHQSSPSSSTTSSSSSSHQHTMSRSRSMVMPTPSTNGGGHHHHHQNGRTNHHHHHHHSINGTKSSPIVSSISSVHLNGNNNGNKIPSLPPPPLPSSSYRDRMTLIQDEDPYYSGLEARITSKKILNNNNSYKNGYDTNGNGNGEMDIDGRRSSSATKHHKGLHWMMRKVLSSNYINILTSKRHKHSSSTSSSASISPTGTSKNSNGSGSSNGKKSSSSTTATTTTTTIGPNGTIMIKPKLNINGSNKKLHHQNHHHHNHNHHNSSTGNSTYTGSSSATDSDPYMSIAEVYEPIYGYTKGGRDGPYVSGPFSSPYAMPNTGHHHGGGDNLTPFWLQQHQSLMNGTTRVSNRKKKSHR